MAVLEKIRNNGPLIVGVIAVALAGFVLTDGLQSAGTWFQADQQNVLEVNGKSVSILDFDEKLKTQQELYEGRSGQHLTDEMRQQLNNSIAEEYIGSIAIDQLTEQIGLQVTPAEVYALLTGDRVTPSMAANQFFAQFGIDIQNKEAVNQLISQLGERQFASLSPQEQASYAPIRQQWRMLQQSVLSERKAQKLLTLLSRSYKVSKVDQEITQGKGSRTVDFVRASTMTAALSDSTLRATDAEIKKYYDEHPNLYLSSRPSTELNLISMQVRPSATDYEEAKKLHQEAYNELSSASTKEDIESALRNHGDQQFYSQAYLTANELEEVLRGAGATTTEIEFVQTAEVGATNTTPLIGDKYTMVKLLGKKSGAEAVSIRMIALDSTNRAKSEELKAQVKAGADFAALAREHSVDPATKENGGLITVPMGYGIQVSEITEYMASQIGLEKVYQEPFGSVIEVDNGNIKFLIQASEAKGAVSKYQVAAVSIPVTFSNKTYNDAYATLNKILGEGGSFDTMAEKAQSAGLDVARGIAVDASSAIAGNIPSSRQIVSWALKAKEGDTAEQLYTCGSDYLAIAHVSKHIEAGIAPLSTVRPAIAARIEQEKAGAKLVADLSAKGLTSLEAYAQELGVSVETREGVDYLVRGSEPAEFNGASMTTAIGSLSKPFYAAGYVYVVKPTSAEAYNEAIAKAQSLQQAQDKGRSLGQSALYSYISKLKVTDNRARFY